MKKVLFSLILTHGFVNLALAQNIIAVLKNSDWTFYDDFSSALIQAQSGSTIYLPGGVIHVSSMFPDSSNSIDKQLNIIGVGHYPDSTLATGRTVIDGTIFLLDGSDNSIIEGLEITNGIKPPPLSNPSIVNNIMIKRCRIQGHTKSFESNISHINNLYITESVILQITGSPYDNLGLLVSNSIIGSASSTSYLSPHNGALFKNNIIFVTLTSYGVSTNHGYCVFENNIIWYMNGEINTGGTIFRNNLFLNPISSCSPCTEFTNNIFASLSETFVNVPSHSFSYAYNYSLLPSSIGKNAGTDGTDIGIYGTSYPYKPSAVPANPHVSIKSISPSSAPNGTLPINIRVISQDR